MDTITGFGSRPVISQPDAALYIHDPMLERTGAIPKMVKVLWWKALQGEPGFSCATAAGLGPDSAASAGDFAVMAMHDLYRPDARDCLRIHLFLAPESTRHYPFCTTYRLPLRGEYGLSETRVESGASLR